jgi:hypothetical protein
MHSQGAKVHWVEMGKLITKLLSYWHGVDNQFIFSHIERCGSGSFIFIKQIDGILVINEFGMTH